MNNTIAQIIAQTKTSVKGMEEVKAKSTIYIAKSGSTLHIYKLDECDFKSMRQHPEQYQIMTRYAYGMNVLGVGAFISSHMVDNVNHFAKKFKLEANLALDFIANHEAGHSVYASRRGFHSVFNMLLTGYNSASIEEEIFCDKYAWEQLGVNLLIDRKKELWEALHRAVAQTLHDFEVKVFGKPKSSATRKYIALANADEFNKRFEGSTGYVYGDINKNALKALSAYILRLWRFWAEKFNLK